MLVIGIAGGSGSGKTTVVNKIIQGLPSFSVSIISQDAYYWDNGHLSPHEKKRINFDHPDSIEWELLIHDLDRLMRIIQRDILERGRLVDTVLMHYETFVKPMHLQFIEPSRRYADLIIPQGGENEVAIELLSSRINWKLNQEK